MSEDNLKIKVDYEWNNLDDKWNTKLMSKKNDYSIHQNYS